MNILGLVGFNHPGGYSYRADLYEGRKRVATAGWSGGSDQYHEDSVEVLSSDRGGVQVGFGGQNEADEDTWKYIEGDSFQLR